MDRFVDRFSRHLGRAVQAMDLGDRLADTLRPSRRPVAVDAAFAVYGQGLFWALTAETAGELPQGAEGAWSAAPPDLLRAAAPDDDLARARRVLARPVAGAADAPDSEAIADLAALRAALQGLIGELRRRRPDPGRLARRRWTRAALVAATGLAAILVAVGALSRRDLAAGKTWVTSSSEPNCDVTTGSCQGHAVNLAFHTRLEDSPWAQVDLGSVRSFVSITVVNRRDCCGERAVPLILEVGDDGVHFRPIAEQRSPFTLWDAKVPEVRARYVRARVAATTVLHLERVTIR